MNYQVFENFLLWGKFHMGLCFGTKYVSGSLEILLVLPFLCFWSWLVWLVSTRVLKKKKKFILTHQKLTFIYFNTPLYITSSIFYLTKKKKKFMSIDIRRRKKVWIKYSQNIYNILFHTLLLFCILLYQMSNKLIFDIPDEGDFLCLVC